MQSEYQHFAIALFRYVIWNTLRAFLPDKVCYGVAGSFCYFLLVLPDFSKNYPWKRNNIDSKGGRANPSPTRTPSRSATGISDGI